MRTSPEPRPDLEGLEPYRTSDVEEGRVFLHANENPYPPPAGVMEEILEGVARLELNRYPDPTGAALVEEIAAYAGVDPSWVWLGDGSNEVLLQACLAYGGPGRTAMLFEPTYVMHHRQARMAGTAVESVSRRDDFTIDIDEAVDVVVSEEPDIVFVCSPNNPTGTTTSLDDIARIARVVRGLVVVDEAYFEFSGQTLVGELGGHPNVLVVRTMSKAFRLAGVRLGYGIAQPELLEQIRAVRMPYAQSSFTQLAGLVALRRRDELLDVVPTIIAERDRMAEAMRERCQVFDSGANFLLFRPRDADALLEALAAEGIVIRDFRSRCDGCLRVTVSLSEHNDAFLAAVASTA